uniref:Uncharacterized protein n=1 Tax=Arundo donax TaxID=35708 RepID=A0A0A8ZRT7_ARUDO
MLFIKSLCFFNGIQAKNKSFGQHRTDNILSLPKGRFHATSILGL